MFHEIPVRNFYGRKGDDVHILNSVQNPNNSDLEEIDIEEDDSLDADLDTLFELPNRNPDTEEIGESSESSSDTDSEYNLPLRELANRCKKRKERAQNMKAPPPPREIWYEEKDNELSNNPPPFLGTYQVNVNGDTPYSFFIQLFPDEIFDLITTETIRYAVQSGKHSFVVTVAEIKLFFAINIMMTYIKYLAYRMYWSSIPGLRFDPIANAMPLKRYEEIKRFLHFKNNDDIPENNEDSFIKIRSFLDILERTFADAATPTEYMAIDEMIIPFKGRSRNKQYIKSKPKKWGFKVWVRASADGFVSKFELYQTLPNVHKTELGVIGDTVVRLCSGLQGLNHKIFMDNLFTSIPTITYLKNKDIHVVGTVRANRIHEANEKLTDGKTLQKRGRGSCSVTTSSNNITVLRWADNNLVHMISTFAGKDPQDVVRRWNRKTKSYVEVQRPQAVIQYNRFMGGVDLSDRMIAHYPHAIKNKKFYLRIIFHFMNIAIINAWLLYRKQKGPTTPLLEFKASIASTLIEIRGSTRKRGRPSFTTMPKKKKAWTKVSPEIRMDGMEHYPVKIDFKNPPRCHDKNCKRRTRYKCGKCQESVCPECMESFHQ